MAFTDPTLLHLFITKTYLCNSDPLKPRFYIVKLGFTGVYIIFLISAQNIDCGYSLEPPRRGDSHEYPQSMFWAEIWKISEFFLPENFQFLVMTFSIYLNRRVFVMDSRDNISYKVHVRLAKTQISKIFAVRNCRYVGCMASHIAPCEDSDQVAARTSLSLVLAHMQFCRKYCAMTQYSLTRKCYVWQKRLLDVCLCVTSSVGSDEVTKLVLLPYSYFAQASSAWWLRMVCSADHDN